MKMRARTPATILRVIDGDTVLARLTCPCCRVQSEQRIRLAGIDAPELDGDHRADALVSRDALARRIEGKQVEIMIVRQWPDRYGRVIGRIYDHDGDVNRWMLDNRLAITYTPGALII